MKLLIEIEMNNAAFADDSHGESARILEQVGMGKGRGFEIVEIMLCAHGGAHNDTICLAERLTSPELFL